MTDINMETSVNRKIQIKARYHYTTIRMTEM